MTTIATGLGGATQRDRIEAAFTVGCPSSVGVAVITLTGESRTFTFWDRLDFCEATLTAFLDSDEEYADVDKARVVEIAWLEIQTCQQKALRNADSYIPREHANWQKWRSLPRQAGDTVAPTPPTPDLREGCCVSQCYNTPEFKSASTTRERDRFGPDKVWLYCRAHAVDVANAQPIHAPPTKETP